ncbi:response regulator [Luteibacter aegosomatis]|uniref:response regulator n=1 Tax=Luteibacter aegosomatis TaxID=2911537 RepID=UPI001FFBEFFB|nr:response regulator [Luteibacter aegosomatis]UPG86413.1 response regulator [Luteibacter aegosomatis]
MATQRTILLVEDEPMIRDVTTWTLEDLGYVVHAAASREEAEKWLAENDAPDLLFTDMRMKGESDGRELAERYGKDMPVLVTSGEAAAQHTWLGGNMRYLPKPYDRKSLRVALDALL